MLDEDGTLPGVDRVLLVDSLAAMAGGAASASSATTYIESAAGVGDGARTGLASVVTGVLFLGALLVTPLVTVVPFEAASPALVIVGFLLLSQIRNIDFDDLAIAIPAFLTIVLMPFTYSITVGIGAIAGHQKIKTILLGSVGETQSVELLAAIGQGGRHAADGDRGDLEVGFRGADGEGVTHARGFRQIGERNLQSVRVGFDGAASDGFERGR